MGDVDAKMRLERILLLEDEIMLMLLIDAGRGIVLIQSVPRYMQYLYKYTHLSWLNM